ncbi:MAG: phosphoribosylamine--glycine ligase [bacterium]
MKVLVVGGGGREHTLCWKLAQSGEVEKVFCAPGNAGIAGDAECVPISDGDIGALAGFAEEKKIDLTVVGPEAPLVAGIADAFQARGLRVFGPSAKAAALEGSKIFAKEFMRKWNIPTAAFNCFDSYEEASSYLDAIPYPTVVKADGLAAGKGVCVAENKKDADKFLKTVMLDKKFGDAGDRVVIEDCMEGEEASIIAVCDGENIVVLVPSQDHKRIFDNDKGPNTGGMGAYAPVSIVPPELVGRVTEEILMPVACGMAEDGVLYRGVIYAGLMLGDEGPKVLEFNVRFGDPETQVVLPMLDGDLAALCAAAADGNLSGVDVAVASGAAVCVVMASGGSVGGYPGSYEKGRPIGGLEKAGGMEGVVVFHAGTTEKDGRIVTSGGRVLGVTATGKDFTEARKRAYAAVEAISFDGAHYRKDIGAREMKRRGE